MSAASPTRADDLAERLSRIPTRLNEFGYDAFGFSPRYLAQWAQPALWLYRHYFRVETHGLHNLPEGRVLIIANHSGQIPIDAAMIAIGVLLEGSPPRMLRSMIERWAASLPFVSTFMARCGQVVGTPENCRRLLELGEAILVFPEGVRGINKTYDKAYQLQDFGYGFMRLALETRTPIVPVAVIGAEEQAPALYNLKPLARLIRAPAFPITPTFPLVPVLGMLPYPSKYRLYFGEPMHFEGDPNDEDAAIEPHVRAVRNTIQSMLQLGLKERKHIFW